MLMTVANTPEFSPIENMFSEVKKAISDFNFDVSKEIICYRVAETMFNFTSEKISSFFRRTLNNFKEFWNNEIL